jgi:hypothetical protein
MATEEKSDTSERWVGNFSLRSLLVGILVFGLLLLPATRAVTAVCGIRNHEGFYADICLDEKPTVLQGWPILFKSSPERTPGMPPSADHVQVNWLLLADVLICLLLAGVFFLGAASLDRKDRRPIHWQVGLGCWLVFVAVLVNIWLIPQNRFLNVRPVAHVTSNLIEDEKTHHCITDAATELRRQKILSLEGRRGQQLLVPDEQVKSALAVIEQYATVPTIRIDREGELTMVYVEN